MYDSPTASVSVKYHVTHKRNVPNIKKTGLDPAYSRGKLQAVWTCEDWSFATLEHIANCHGWRVGDLCILAVLSPIAGKRKFLRGLGIARHTATYTESVIPAQFISVICKMVGK